MYTQSQVAYQLAAAGRLCRVVAFVARRDRGRPGGPRPPAIVTA